MAGLDTLQPGLWVPATAPHCMQQASPVAANFARGVRVVAPKSMTITKIGFILTVAATADDPVDIAIYQPVGPGSQNVNRLGSTGALSGLLNSALGIKTPPLTAPVNLIGGQVYYGVLGCGPVGGTVAQVAGVATSAGALFGSSVPNMEMITVVAFPLPATYGPPGLPGSAPMLAFLQ